MEYPCVVWPISDGSCRCTRRYRLAAGQQLCPVSPGSSRGISCRSIAYAVALRHRGIQRQGEEEEESREADSRPQGNAAQETEAVSTSRADATAGW